MGSDRLIRRLAFVAGGSALACMGILAAGSHGLVPHADVTADAVHAPLAPGDGAGNGPTTSTAASVAPANPVDCSDPNNVVNCQSPPVDSPLVEGTAAPGSPYRD